MSGMLLRRVCRLGFGFAILAFWTQPGSALDWTNYTSVTEILSLDAHNDTLWLASTGGLVRLVSDDPGAQLRLTSADGLGGNDLRFVTAAPSGTIWTGGSNGRLTLLRGDGVVAVYSFTDEDGLPIELHAAASGGDQFLWVGSVNGVHKFDTERHGGELTETYQRIGGWPDAAAVGDVGIAGNTVWLAGEAGVARAAADDPFLLIRNHWDSWSDLGAITSLGMVGDVIYAGGSDGLFMYTSVPGGESGDSAWAGIGFTDDAIVDLAVSSDTLWVATTTGIGYCTGTECVRLTIPGAVAAYFTSISVTSDGVIWAGQRGRGVWSRRDGAWNLTPFAGPLSNNVGDVAVGHDGKVWFVFPNHGAAFLESGIWTQLPYYTVGPSSPGEAVTVAANGDVWFGAFGAGAFRVDPSRPLAEDGWTRYDSSNSTLMWFQNEDLTPNNFVLVTDVTSDKEGRVWFANTFADSGRALAFYDDGCWGIFDVNDGVVLPGLRAVLTATVNSLVIGTAGSGVLEMTYPEPLCLGGEPLPTQGVTVRKDTDDGLPSNTVSAVLVDRLDSLWVGTNLGLAKWEPRFRQFLTVTLPAAAGLQINAIAADAANGIWVGTSLGLVHRAPDGTAEFYNTDNSGLVGNDVQAVAVDDNNGDIWIATLSGISQAVGPPPAADPITGVHAYPNPVVITEEGTARVRFNAPPGSRVIIYTVSGSRIAEESATAGWDLRNAAGRIVVSGVYLFVVRGPDGDYARGKFAVINRR